MNDAKKTQPAKKVAKAPAAAPTPASGAPPASGPLLIRCRRVDAVYSAEEHRQCPYCYGKEADVQTGDHRRFCDFKPGEDPINFGFPQTFGRYGS